MIRTLLEALLVIRFVRYEHLTGILFQSLARRDALFSQPEAARLWLDFDTTSAPAVTGFVRLLERAYGIDWRGKSPRLKQAEKRARHSCTVLLQSLGTVRKLHRERKKILREFRETRCRLDTAAMRREISRLVK